MTTEEIVNAIRNATNGTFVGGYSSTTLMGWTRIYDKQGREVTCDPNYKESGINICGVDYKIVRCKWDVYIFKPEYFDTAHYTTLWKPESELDKMLLTKIDLTPDYVKEYWEKHE